MFFTRYTFEHNKKMTERKAGKQLYNRVKSMNNNLYQFK